MTLRDDWLRSYSEPVGFSEGAPKRSCGTVPNNQALMEMYPPFRRLLSELENEIAARMAEPAAFAGEEPVTIPVVAHVVWHDLVENISEAQVQGQIDALNRDFAAANPDRSRIPSVWRGMSVDSGIRFRLATRDPAGIPCSGITRTRTQVRDFPCDNSVKYAASGGADSWDADRYLNLWVCNLTPWLAYAQLPGGPPETDGVVIGYRWFGTSGTAEQPYHLGRTATHEVGHWLNLRHISGDIEPVPVLGRNGGMSYPCSKFDNASQSARIAHGDNPGETMLMNYMDYAHDDAMVMFTTGQVTRMQATLRSIRSGLIESDGFGSGLPNDG